MAIPVDASAPLPKMLPPALLQQRRALPLPDLTQAGINGLPPARVKHHSAQVKRRCLKGSLEDIWDVHEDDIPGEQAEQGCPDATLCMRACRHRHPRGTVFSTLANSALLMTISTMYADVVVCTSYACV